MHLLHIDSSILGEASASRALSAAIVERLAASGTPIEVTYRDLAQTPPPHLTQGALATIADNPDLQAFLAADIVVIGAPMYNFGLPSTLKAWIDQIVVAGQTFQYDADGAKGLAGEKCVIIAHSRGGLYAEGSAVAALEHAESHLRAIFTFLGVADIEFVIAEGLAMGEEPREAALAQARVRIARIAGPAPRNAA